MLAALLNGRPIIDAKHALSVEERGLAYGHGLFETMSLRDGRVRFVDDHLARLDAGCERLGVPKVSGDEFHADLEELARSATEGIVKVVVTRGAGGRGYRAPSSLAVTRIALLYPKLATVESEIAVRWCDTRLARNAQLAGIKHLNRLEQVLAQNEWTDAAVGEGIMLDTEGEVVCATSSNLFIVSDGILVTPDLRFSGVRGVMRLQVLKMARQLGIAVEERSLWPEDISSADEVFLTNAVRGIRAVTSLDDNRWPLGALTGKLSRAMEST